MYRSEIGLEDSKASHAHAESQHRQRRSQKCRRSQIAVAHFWFLQIWHNSSVKGCLYIQMRRTNCLTWILRINHNSRSWFMRWFLLLATSVAWNRTPHRLLALGVVYMLARDILVHNKEIKPINGSGRPMLNSSILPATGARICVGPLLFQDILSFYFLCQYHPHDEFRIWPSIFLKHNFVSYLDHFITYIHTKVVHPLINKMNESAIFWGFLADKK